MIKILKLQPKFTNHNINPISRFGDALIADNVKVYLSQVLLSISESLKTQLPHIAEVWFGWLASRGVVDNLTEEILSLTFNQEVKITVRSFLFVKASKIFNTNCHIYFNGLTSNSNRCTANYRNRRIQISSQ